MKLFFLIVFIFLALVSVARYLTLPDSVSPVPLIYWGTDANPARQEQVALFHQWLRDHGHVVRDANGQPKFDKDGQLQTICELRLDAVNRDQTKRVIMGISGVGDDIVDIFSSRELIYYTDMGMLSDITDQAKQGGFDPSATFEAVIPEITRDGRQYTYPCNVSFSMFLVNVEMFQHYQQPLPPESWTVAEFEQRGKQFVAAANSPDQRQRLFFTESVDFYNLHRSFGVTTYNETLTASTLNDPRVVQAMEDIYQWTYIHRLTPSETDIQSISTTSNGYGGVRLQLFANGICGMVRSGRHALIQTREFNQTRQNRGQEPIRLQVTNLPYYQFPNVLATTRAAAIYRNSKYKKYAALFLSYLASQDYNMQILRDADSLPPNPRYCLTDEYNHPSDYPEEWGLHEPFYTVQSMAIGEDHSPYVPPVTCQRIVRSALDEYMNHRLTAKKAVHQAATQLNQEIEQTLNENPKIRSQYHEGIALQKKIDQRRKDNQPIPLSWIKNPYHRKYYQTRGWIEPDATE